MSNATDNLTDAVVSVADWMETHAIHVPTDLKVAIEEVKTPAYYRRSLWRNVRDFYDGMMDAGEFIDDMIRLIEGQMTRAWREGMRNVGLDPLEDFLPQYRDALQGIINSEFDHVLDFAQAIEDARIEGLPVDLFKQRVELWVNRYDDIVSQSMVTVQPEQNFRWVYGDTDHCATCASLNGIIATGSQWRESGLEPRNPPNDRLECGGWRCQCRLVPTDDPVTESGIPL